MHIRHRALAGTVECFVAISWLGSMEEQGVVKQEAVGQLDI